MAYIRRNESPAFNSRSPLQLNLPPRRFTVSNCTPVQQPLLSQQPLTLGELILGGLVLGGLGYAAYKAFEPGRATRHCSVCDSTYHDRRSCPHDGPRISFSRSIPMAATCECCGEYPAAQRHHTRGRSDDTDKLDVCATCHLHCGHKGHWQNFPVKPRTCVVTDAPASWRTLN